MSQPRVPADHGLSSLGMLMQLAGGVFAAAAGLFAFITLVEPGGIQKLWPLLVLAASAVRSMFHRNAGVQLLYGNPGDEGRQRTAGVRRYIGFALLHTLLVLFVLVTEYRMPGKLVLAIGFGLALWPVMLAIVFALPSFRRFQDQLPIAEDKGFEGASILMLVFGACGIVAAGSALVALFDAPPGMITRGPGVLVALALVMLVVRSVLHAHAGLTGLRETGVDRAVELANRYANFGVISAFCCGGALMMYVIKLSWQVTGLAMIAALCWMLMAWPLTIRRFFSDRQFTDLLAGDQAPVHHRAPDAGLTGLGWLLVAHAAYSAAFVIPQLALGDHVTNAQSELLALGTSTTGRSVWFSIGLVVLQGWAGVELVRMSVSARFIAIAFGVLGAATHVYLMWPAINALRHARGLLDPDQAIVLGPMAISLILPIATLALVSRKIAPTARARFRARVGS